MLGFPLSELDSSLGFTTTRRRIMFQRHFGGCFLLIWIPMMPWCFQHLLYILPSRWRDTTFQLPQFGVLDVLDISGLQFWLCQRRKSNKHPLRQGCPQPVLVKFEMVLSLMRLGAWHWLYLTELGWSCGRPPFSLQVCCRGIAEHCMIYAWKNEI